MTDLEKYEHVRRAVRAAVNESEGERISRESVDKIHERAIALVSAIIPVGLTERAAIDALVALELYVSVAG